MKITESSLRRVISKQIIKEMGGSYPSPPKANSSLDLAVYEWLENWMNENGGDVESAYDEMMGVIDGFYAEFKEDQQKFDKGF